MIHINTYLEAFSVASGLTASTGISPADRKSSDVRIYCDNDERWSLVPDLTSKKLRKAGLLNSQLPKEKQQWWDENNFIYRSASGKGCGDDGTMAQTYNIKTEGTYDLGTQDGQKATREAITVWKFAFPHRELQ